MNIFDQPIDEQPQDSPPAVTTMEIDFTRMLAQAKAQFQPYKTKIESIKKEVTEFEIKTDSDCQQLTETAARAAKLAKDLEEKRKDIIKKPDSFVRSLNSFVKGYREILTEPRKKSGLVEIAKTKIGNYQYQKELERRKAEKKAQEEQAKLQAKINKEAAAAGVEAPQLPAQEIPQGSAPIRTEAGSASFSTEWTYELEDIGKVPADYLMVDDKKVKMAIKAGIREIPGLVIKEVPAMRLRTS